jgi:Family of unknown function (DUF6289)
MRRILLVFALVILPTGLMTAAAQPAGAQTAGCGSTVECLWYYYNNAQHSTLVGDRVITCNGQNFHSGISTPYYDFSDPNCR